MVWFFFLGEERSSSFFFGISLISDREINWISKWTPITSSMETERKTEYLFSINSLLSPMAVLSIRTVSMLSWMEYTLNTWINVRKDTSDIENVVCICSNILSQFCFSLFSNTCSSFLINNNQWQSYYRIRGCNPF